MLSSLQDGCRCLRRIAFGPSLRVMEMVPKEEAKEEEEKGPQPSEAESGVAPMGKVPTTLAGRIEMAFHQARGSSLLFSGQDSQLSGILGFPCAEVCADGKHIGDVLKSMFPYNFEGNTAFCKALCSVLKVSSLGAFIAYFMNNVTVPVCVIGGDANQLGHPGCGF